MREEVYSNGCFEDIIPVNVRGCHVFVVQTFLPNRDSMTYHVIQTAQIINAARLASAGPITLVVPHFGWDRSDKKWTGRMAITGRLMAHLFSLAGMTRFLGIDLHSAQFQGFFPPTTIVDHLESWPLFVKRLRKESLSANNAAVFPGDYGYAAEARNLGQYLGLPVGNVEKQRINDKKVKIESVTGPIKGRTIILCDDQILNGTTIRGVVDHLADKGAKKVIVAVTNGLFSQVSIDALNHPLIEKILVTDGVPIPSLVTENLPIEIVSIIELIANAIREIYDEGSISGLIQRCLPKEK